MLEKLKILLGIEDDSKDFILQFTINTITDMVLNYCHIKEIPSGLENIVICMCIDKYRAENYGQENSEGTVKSISEGDVSVSFGSAFSTSENPSMEFLKNYKSQLNIYRKVGW